jgi:hypothetical protein
MNKEQLPSGCWVQQGGYYVMKKKGEYSGMDLYSVDGSVWYSTEHKALEVAAKKAEIAAKRHEVTA